MNNSQHTPSSAPTIRARAMWGVMPVRACDTVMPGALALIALLMSFVCPTPVSAQRYEVKRVTGERILIDSRYAPDPSAEAYLSPFTHQVDSVMSPVVGRSARFMKPRFPESELSNLLADILVWSGKRYGEEPVIGLYNLGGIRASLPEGVVTFGDINDIAPFENKICFLTLTGRQLKALFSQIGHKYGSGVSHSIRATYSRGDLLSLLVDGEEVSDAKTYRIATIDYLIQGNDGFRELRNGTDLISPQDKESNTRYLIAEYFRYKASLGEAVDAVVEGRINIVR
ncbi:MAG: 5'-nucleotidase C-terminal domain-containing protein [Prevotella sp.]